MATYTEHFSLVKPDDEEYYDVQDFNGNMDVIDEALAESAGGAELLKGILSPDGQGVRIVKSIQHKTVTLGEAGRTEVAIQPVDAARCVVISERLYDPFGYTAKMVYSLSNDKIIIQPHQGNASYQIIYGFWVVEFY